MRVLRVSHSATVGPWRARERELRRRGDDVQLVTARRWHAGGVAVTLEPEGEDWVTPASTVGRHPALFLYSPMPLWRALGERWDVIDLHEEPFALATAEVLLLRALRRNRAPVVLYTAQNLVKRYPVPFRWLERWALRSAAGISACNAAAARIAEAKGFAGRARVIPLGVDAGPEPETDAPGVPAAAAARDASDAGAHEAVSRESDARANPRSIVVGFIGRIVPEKGLAVLLSALETDPRLTLLVAGHGDAGTFLSRVGEDARARVRTLGPLAPDRVGEFYGSIDVLAVPSLPTRSWTEQFGRVAVEAMAAGVPVVSSDAGALPDVVGGAGIVVPAGDAQALADALTQAAGPRRAELVAAGRARARQCSWPAVAEEYRALYASVTHSPVAVPSGVEIVVVAYGSVGLLRRALTPVADAAVTVIDNSSLPEIARLCEELGVRYRDPGRNLGFAAAVNLALGDRLLPDADVLLLNPDAEISLPGIVRLQTALRAEPGLASVGPAQVDDSGRPARVTWPFPAPHRSCLDAVGLGRLARGPRFVIGSVLLLRAEALSQVGGFDERFFLYAEETDWAYRAHRLGWRHREVREVRAVHAAGGTSADPRRREAHFFASQERYLTKHFGTAGWQVARIAGMLGASARALLLRGARQESARRRAALYRLGPVAVEKRFREAG